MKHNSNLDVISKKIKFLLNSIQNDTINVDDTITRSKKIHSAELFIDCSKFCDDYRKVLYNHYLLYIYFLNFEF